MPKEKRVPTLYVNNSNLIICINISINKNTMLRILLSLSLLASFTSVAKAQDYSRGKIQEIEIDSRGNIKVLQENALFPDECRAISRYWQVKERSNDLENNFLVALLTAYQSGQSVEIRRVGSDVCYQDRLPTIKQMLLR